ncbi:Cytochrome CYP366D1, partial [Operophtera brumata]
CLLPESCTIPIGTGCAINAWGAGRSKQAWGPDAREYKPERWLTGESRSTPAAFLAFSYGRRSCIGKRYAMTILKTVLSYCVRELEFTSDADKLELKIDIALRAISGHLIQVKLRK